jgi:hypothetical protein
MGDEMSMLEREMFLTILWETAVNVIRGDNHSVPLAPP